MPVFVVFLRAINVTGRFVKMAALAEAFWRLGYEDARTYINSGNVILSSRVRSPAKLAAAIEAGLPRQLGFESEAFVRTEAGVHAIALRTVGLLEQAVEVNVAFLAAPITLEQRGSLAALRTDIDTFEAEGEEIYWLCHRHRSESKFSTALLERRLQTRTTLRRASMLQGLARELQ